ncbi:MAG: response regulator [Halobacteriota archaeon]
MNSEKMVKAKILVVEDEALVAESLEIAITDLGYEVVGHAASADGAVKMAAALEPDLILMDIVLKGQKMLGDIQSSKRAL